MENKYYTDPDKIGKFIRHLRESHNLTQDQLGKKLFITRKAISKWETGKAVPSLEMMHDIADVFGVNFNEIVEGEFEKDTSSTYAKFKKIAIRILSVLLALSILTLLIFFYENRNSTIIYKVGYVDENFLISEGSLVISADTINFKIGNFSSYDTNLPTNPNYEFILYYKNNQNEITNVVKFDSVDFNYNEKENNKLNIKALKENVDELYLKVTYEDKDHELISTDLHLITEIDEEEVAEETENTFNEDNLRNHSKEDTDGSYLENNDTTGIDLSFLYKLSSEELKEKFNKATITINDDKFKITYHDYGNIKIYDSYIQIIIDIETNIIHIKSCTISDCQTEYINIISEKVELKNMNINLTNKISKIIENLEQKSYQ